MTILFHDTHSTTSGPLVDHIPELGTYIDTYGHMSQLESQGGMRRIGSVNATSNKSVDISAVFTTNSLFFEFEYAFVPANSGYASRGLGVSFNNLGGQIVYMIVTTASNSLAYCQLHVETVSGANTNITSFCVINGYNLCRVEISESDVKLYINSVLAHSVSRVTATSLAETIAKLTTFNYGILESIRIEDYVVPPSIFWENHIKTREIA